ncbi:MAG: FlgD immunoglobulin-like domain containing protein [bacterium]
MNQQNRFKTIIMKKHVKLWITVIFVSLIFTPYPTTYQRKCIDTKGPTKHDSPESDAMEALEFWSAQRAYPNSVIPDEGLYKAFEYTKKSLRKGESSLNASDTWRSIGPANRGGRTIALAVDPQNPNVVYAGSASGGLWRLTMDGNTYSWEYIDTGFPVLGVNAIAVDPTNSDIIYIGTGEVYGYQESIGGLYVRTTRGSYGIGLLKTTDRGATWAKKIDWSYHQQRGVLAIRINPFNSNSIFAGTTEGTFKSNDAGQTWEKVHPVLMAVDIAIDPADTNIVYVSCGNLGSPDTGIYRSTEGGRSGSWTKLGNGLPSDWGGKALLSIYKSSPNVIYASIGNGYTDYAGTWLCKSSDSGEHWMVVNTQNYSSYQGWFSHYVRVNPMDESKIFCAGVYFYSSNDGGRTLIEKSNMHVDHHAYADHPIDPNIVYFGNDGGVYRTLDGGKTFQEINNGYVTTQFYNGFSSSPVNPDLALGGLQDNGTIMYVGNLNWRKGDPLPGGDGAFTAVHPTDDNIMYSSSQHLNIYQSLDGGFYWTAVSRFYSGRDVCFVAPFVLSPSHPSIMYAGQDVIYKSYTAGADWEVMNGRTSLNGNPILSIAVSPTHPEIVYAATAPSPSKRAEVFATTDGGLSWENITGNLPDRYYVDLQVSPHSNDVAYVTLSGFGSSHLYRTEDGGRTWSDIGNDLPDIPTSAVIVDPEDYKQIYVGNDLGVYVSTDYGGSWREFREGLPAAVLVMDLSISPSDHKIRAVTHGNGVYERSLLPLDGENPQPIPTDFLLLQNYPNPFNSETTISFGLPTRSFVTIIIQNVRGQKIRTLIRRSFGHGTYKITWNGTDDDGRSVPSGTYLYSLITDAGVITKRMSLVR